MNDKSGLLTRREWFAASGLAAGVVTLGRPGSAIAAPSVPTAPVAIAKCGGYDGDLTATMQKLFDQVGGIGNLVRDKTVTIKLNLTGGGRFPGFTVGETVWVHPKVVGAAVAAIGKAGAKRIRLLEGAGRRGGSRGSHSLEDKMLDGGWDVDAIRRAAPVVEFEDSNGLGSGQKYSRLKVPTKPYIYPAFDYNHTLEDTDVYVSLGKLKNHEELGLTGAMKNHFGATPTALYGSRETVFHYGKIQPPNGAPAEIDFKSDRYEGWRMPRLIVDLVASRPIHISILDAIVSLAVGEGPWVPGTTPIKPGFLVVGLNPVCTDTVGFALAGYNPRGGRDEAPFNVDKEKLEQAVTKQYTDNYLLLAEAVGLGSANLRNIDVRGVPIKDAVFKYEPYHDAYKKKRAAAKAAAAAK